jgi:hypothetical protein
VNLRGLRNRWWFRADQEIAFKTALRRAGRSGKIEGMYLEIRERHIVERFSHRTISVPPSRSVWTLEPS